MKITVLRTTNNCPDIQSCPAQLTIDRHPERRYVIVNQETDPMILTAAAHRIGPGEVLGWAESDLFDGSEEVDLWELVARHHRTDLLRVQTLDFYGVASDDDFARYLDGAPEPRAAGKADWLARLRDDTAAGKIRRTVHIVREPLSDYLRYQAEWWYRPNVQAGQQVRILSLTDTPAAAALLRVGDFAIVEAFHAVRLRYGTDGAYEGAVAAGDDASRAYRALGEVAWQLAVPFTDWWATHSRYHRAVRAA